MLKAFAKINLSLFVTGLREDGYHEIRSIFIKIGLFDAIWITPHTHPEVTATLGPDAKDNIVWKALQNRPYRIHIQKNIPIGAGLGGGSSDAASVLKFFERNRAIKFASLLGSDVPFFIYDSNAAIVKGRGEIVEPFEIKPSFFIVLYNPGVEFCTREGYKLLREKRLYYPSKEADERILQIKNSLIRGNLKELGRLIFNTFEEIHEESFITEFKEFMEKMGACCALMTGSGSTLFAIFEEFPKDLFENYHDRFIFTSPLQPT